MKYDDLATVLFGQVNIEDIRETIQADVSEYQLQAGKRGSSQKLRLEGLPIELVIQAETVRHLCELYLEGVLDEWELRYICDLLLLSQHAKFESENLFEALESLTDLEIGVELSPYDVKRIAANV